MRVVLVLALSGVMLAGCSYRRDPGSEILVQTEPPGAACTVWRQGAPIAEVNPTPAIALVSRSPAEIAIACRRPGYADAGAVTRSRDIGTGWDDPKFEYDNPVTIRMPPR